ncbi:homoserine O-succinyltransferase [Nocardia sp. NPDC050406]|uniref:homoserine O-acetyltransferase/O-succinyltransferase family protein n=1 Tax=Nocardia sp. NPDC050406 TaxID=3364318 RepID=UPI0037AA8B99
MFASTGAPRSRGATLRIGIVDLISLRPESTTRRVFAEAVARGAEELGASEILVETEAFGIDPLRPVDGVDWRALAEMDALIVSGSEPTTEDIADEPCLAVVDRILRECSESALLFSCQSAHAALYLLYGVRRQRLARRQHGVFDHWVRNEWGAAPETAAMALLAGLSTPVRVPHSRWNAMTSADLRAAGVNILLDSDEAEWHLAADGLRHVFVQGHPEYLCDTMAREYRRDLRRWLGDVRRPFPDIPQRYFAREVEESLLDQAARLRASFDPALLEDFPLPVDRTEVTTDWSAHAATFFANWIRAIAASVDTRAEEVADIAR